MNKEERAVSANKKQNNAALRGYFKRRVCSCR